MEPETPAAEPTRPGFMSGNGLERQLADVLNRCCAENTSNTPDFILASFLFSCLTAWNTSLRQRAEWYGRMDYPGQPASVVAAPAAGGTWQPIETLPPCSEDSCPPVLVWSSKRGRVEKCDEVPQQNAIEWLGLTHWMPLPAAPAGATTP